MFLYVDRASKSLTNCHIQSFADSKLFTANCFVVFDKYMMLLISYIFQTPSVVDPDGMNSFDLITNNEHLHESEVSGVLHFSGSQPIQIERSLLQILSSGLLPSFAIFYCLKGMV